MGLVGLTARRLMPVILSAQRGLPGGKVSDNISSRTLLLLGALETGLSVLPWTSLGRVLLKLTAVHLLESTFFFFWGTQKKNGMFLKLLRWCWCNFLLFPCQILSIKMNTEMNWRRNRSALFDHDSYLNKSKPPGLIFNIDSQARSFSRGTGWQNATGISCTFLGGLFQDNATQSVPRCI